MILYIRWQFQVKRIQSVPLVIGQFLEAVDQDHAIVGSTTGSISRFAKLRRCLLAQSSCN